jgi:hypothetical protein
VILETATLPIDGMTVCEGVPLINGLPVTNLSSGEKLSLAVQVTLRGKGNLKMLLLDGAESLDDESRLELYAKCKEFGVQLIASRTTSDNELTVTEI